MSNLTTRKIVLGMLITLVLAFSVQGIAEALTLSPSTSPGDLSTVTEGATITVSGISGGLNNTSAAERVAVAITGNATANFPDPEDGVTPITNDTYTEQTTTSVTVLNNGSGNGTIDIPSSLVITARTAGTITVTVSWIPTDSSTETSKAFTFYAVPDSNSTATDAAFDASNANGYHSASNQIQISPGSAGLLAATTANLPLRYIVSGGYLFVKEAARTNTKRIGAEIVSSSAPVYLNMSGTTVVVSVYVEGHNSQRQSARVTVIHRYPRLSKVSGDSPKQAGSPGAKLLHPFVVRVTDAGGGNVRGQKVTFLSHHDSAADDTFITRLGTFEAHPDFPDEDDIPAGAPRTDIDTTTIVTTDSSGNAKVFLVLGAKPGEYRVTAQFPPANAVTQTATFKVSFRAEAVSEAEASTLTKVAETDGQTADAFGRLEKPLTVIVYDQGGNPIDGVPVTFQDRSGGTLSRLPNDPGSLSNEDSAENLRIRLIDTDKSGEASIRYKAREGGAVHTVSAFISDRGYQEVIFTINGTASSGGGGGGGDDDADDADVDDDIISFSRTSITGEAGDEEDIRVTSTPSGVVVSLSSPDFANSNFSPQSETTPFTTTLTLPDDTGAYDIFATRSGFTPAEGTVTVEAEGLGTLTISPSGTPTNGEQRVNITARTSGGAIPAGAVPVTLSGTGFTTTRATVLTGTVSTNVTLPTTAATYTLIVRATGYNPATTRLTVRTTTTRGPAGVADSVEIDGQRQLSGTVNESEPLRVRVLDANDNGVEDVRVAFRVLAPGRGTFSGGRGNRRGVTDETDRNGYASANFTPSDDGDIIVRATAAGVRDPVTFIIAVGEAADDPETPTPSRDVPPSRDISPVVHVGVSSRPPMLWVDGGAIYALVGADAQKFAPSVDNALNIVIGGGKVYWTEKTGESGGTINSANLDGTDVKELKSIKAVPMGIAVDTAGSKLYWTNSRGRIQSANLDGSGITNELQDLPSPMDIALARGLVYWTQGNGSVRVVNLRGQKIVRDISTGTDTPGSLVIGGSKVYWTEMTGDSSGTVNSANLNGTDVKELKSIQAVPMGIAVDGSRSKLYWTNSRGRVQSANLDGSGITNVVSGLGSPGDMVLSNSITAPAAAPAETASGSKYDVNGDGTVDNADSDAVTVAIAAGATDAKYDVNGDGTVNVFDLVEIIANRDPGAAGAPTLFGMKMSAAQIDSLQEQIDLLIAANDRSPAALRTLIYLQQLLVTARPEKTQLLANYPNPFNPETWIPYELATDTNVRITIYNTQGVVIRTLQFGHQSAGYYAGRDRAAYWDGRNALGEQVASGLYFYQLETDEMSLMRKMVILK